MKKIYTTKEVFTLDNFNNPFRNNHRPENYNLSEYFRKVYSQHGEDGLLEYLYSKIKPRHKYYVEFGARSGNGIENTHNLRVNCGWTGLLMEGNETNVAKSNGLCNLEWINSQNIMDLFEKYEVPKDFDFLSIDIDSDDVYVFDAIDFEKYKPSVVIGEYNPGIPNHLPLAIEEGKSDYGKDYHEPKNNYFPMYHGCNIHAWCVAAKKKGYSIITTCGVNVVMVRNDYIDLFDIPSLDDITASPYFVKEIDRYNKQKDLDEKYKWILFE